MATYTADQLKDRTSVPAVNAWSDDKILAYQTMAESVLNSLDLDTSVSGYSDAYNSCVLILFDWFAENATGAKSRAMGKVKLSWETDLPVTAKAILEPYVLDGFPDYAAGGTVSLQPAILERRDIGRR